MTTAEKIAHLLATGDPDDQEDAARALLESASETGPDVWALLVLDVADALQELSGLEGAAYRWRQAITRLRACLGAPT